MVEPVYPPVKGDTSSEVPTFVDGDGNEVDKPAAGEGQDEVKFDPGEDAPDGAQVDPDSGVVTIPEVPAKGEDPVVVPVVVTYPDGSTDAVEVPVKVTEADKPVTDSVDPKYAQDTVVKAGESGTVVAPKDADGNALPEGTKFVPGKDVPEWAKVNPDGSITVAPGKDVVPGDYKVPVVVTYPDGSTDAVEVPVKVTEGGKGRTDAGKPAWDDASTPADKTVVIPNKGGDVVEGTTVEVEGPGKAEIGADGSLKVTPSADAKPGDKIVAKVKDGEGNVIDTVTVTLTDPEGGKGRTDAGKPAWDDASTPADKTVVIPNKGGDVVEGTTVEVEGPGKAEIGADGSLKVTPSADAKPGDKIVAKVKDGEGNVIDTVTVRISENVRGNSRKVVRTIARTSIAKTGVQVFGYGAASAALLLAGVGVIAAARRCKED